MENFVQMSLERYDSLKFSNDSLKRQQIAQQETYSNYVAQTQKKIHDLEEKIEQYKKYILKLRCDWLDVENNSLEYYLNINSWSYGMNDKDKLLSIGFTKEEMDEFIADKYEEYVKVQKKKNKLVLQKEMGLEENTDD